ncbi:MAG TPA: hypothetical protein VMM92_13855 [Thermoanaerobaculia bacterium]|nr:hypothetical protein [Thermoanaerobaculia bacterium]
MTNGESVPRETAGEAATAEGTSSRARRLGLWLLVLLWAVLAAWICHRLAGKALDDFFITYRYAANLAAGQGFTYNPGEKVFGTTEPGVALLLALLTVLTRVAIPTLGTFVTGGSLLGIAALLLLEAGERGRRAEAAAGGTLLLVSTFLWVCHGAGAFPTLLCLMLAARLGDRRPEVAGLLAGLAVWMRPDAAVGVGLLGLLLWAERRRLPWRYGLSAAAVLLAGAWGARHFLGSLLPNTLAAKRIMGAAFNRGGAPQGFWSPIYALLERHEGPYWLLLAGFAAAGLVPLVLGMGRAGRLLALSGAALAVLYPVLKVPLYPWYALPVVITGLYGVAYFAGGVARGLARLAGQRWLAVALFALLLAPAAVSILPTGWRWLRGFDWAPYLKTYQQAGLYIHQRSQPADDIAYIEIGVLGYYSRQPFFDLLGLVSPDILPYVAKRDLPGAFLTRPTAWVIYYSGGRMGRILDRRWFWNAYEDVAHFKDEDGGGELTVFRRKPGAALPEAPPPGVGGWNRR